MLGDAADETTAYLASVDNCAYRKAVDNQPENPGLAASA
jgi:hypothetical protein